MKFAYALLLAGVAHADDFADCGELTTTLYTDSDCKTKKADGESKETPKAGCEASGADSGQITCSTTQMKT
jgi:hypothetical protein